MGRTTSGASSAAACAVRRRLLRQSPVGAIAAIDTVGGDGIPYRGQAWLVARKRASSSRFTDPQLCKRCGKPEAYNGTLYYTLYEKPGQSRDNLAALLFFLPGMTVP